MTDERFPRVIFDCDGVLVDSELITSGVFAQILGELGLVLSVTEVHDRFVGKSTPQCLEMITAWLGRELPAGFLPEDHRRTMAALPSELKAVPGIEAALDVIRLPYCVASNGSYEKMQTTLGVTG